MIDLDLNTGRFVIPLPHPESEALFAKGWRQFRPGYLETSQSEALEGFEHLFSPALTSQLVGFDRQLAEIDEKTWAEIVPAGKTLLEHQAFTVRFAIGAGAGESTAIGDAPGAGKTAVNVVLANYWRPNEWLIVCPSSVKYNWKHEIEVWGTGRPFDMIIVCEHANLAEDLARIEAARAENARIVVIINYDIMLAYESVIKNGFIWDMVTYDESHRFKTTTSNRTLYALGRTAPGRLPRKLSFKVDRGIQFKQRLFTTATSMDRPIHLWPTIAVCDPDGLGADYYGYVERYCFSGWSHAGTMLDRGSHHTDELGYLLGKKFFVRHDIDHLLPPFREETVILAPDQTVADAERDLFAELFARLDETAPDHAAQIRQTLANRAAVAGLTYREGYDEQTSIHLYKDTFVEHVELLTGIPATFEMMTKLRRITGQAKIAPLIKMLEDLLEAEPDEPVVVMLHHKENVEAVRERFAEISARVVGGVSSKKRKVIVDEFQAGKIQLFIGNIAAAGEGLTLTRSCRLIFGEIDWNATAMWQALKRVHRLTQAREVTIQYLLLDESLDALIANSYIGKRQGINEFFEGAELARMELVNGKT